MAQLSLEDYKDLLKDQRSTLKQYTKDNFAGTKFDQVISKPAVKLFKEQLNSDNSYTQALDSLIKVSDLVLNSNILDPYALRAVGPRDELIMILQSFLQLYQTQESETKNVGSFKGIKAQYLQNGPPGGDVGSNVAMDNTMLGQRMTALKLVSDSFQDLLDTVKDSLYFQPGAYKKAKGNQYMVVIILDSIQNIKNKVSRLDDKQAGQVYRKLVRPVTKGGVKDFMIYNSLQGQNEYPGKIVNQTEVQYFTRYNKTLREIKSIYKAASSPKTYLRKVLSARNPLQLNLKKLTTFMQYMKRLNVTNQRDLLTTVAQNIARKQTQFQNKYNSAPYNNYNNIDDIRALKDSYKTQNQLDAYQNRQPNLTLQQIMGLPTQLVQQQQQQQQQQVVQQVVQQQQQQQQPQINFGAEGMEQRITALRRAEYDQEDWNKLSRGQKRKKGAEYRNIVNQQLAQRFAQEGMMEQV